MLPKVYAAFQDDGSTHFNLYPGVFKAGPKPQCVEEKACDWEKNTLCAFTLTANMDGKMILLYQLDDPDNPIQLAFQKKYGDIVSYKWFGEGFMMIGFSEGYLVVVSTNLDEIGEEIFSGRFRLLFPSPQQRQ